MAILLSTYKRTHKNKKNKWMLLNMYVSMYIKLTYRFIKKWFGKQMTSNTNTFDSDQNTFWVGSIPNSLLIIAAYHIRGLLAWLKVCIVLLATITWIQQCGSIQHRPWPSKILNISDKKKSIYYLLFTFYLFNIEFVPLFTF